MIITKRTVQKVTEMLKGKVFEDMQDPEGTTCPCCDRYAKLQKRKLNNGMVLSLLWLVKQYANTGKWIDVPNTAPRAVLKAREFGKLEKWGLVKRAKNNDMRKKDSGLWIPTAKGIKFVNGIEDVPMHMYMYNNKVWEWSEEIISIQDATNFDYQELINS